MYCFISSLKSAKVRREQELLALVGSGESYTERAAGICPDSPGQIS